MRRLLIAVLLLLWASAAWGGMQAPRRLVAAGGGGGSTLEIRTFDTGTGTSSAECSMSVNSGELLVVSSAAEQNSGDITISSSPSITWTSQISQGTPTGGGCRARIWTAEASSTGTMTVTTTASSSGGSSCVLYAITGEESTLGGATAMNNPTDVDYPEIQGVPNSPITTTRDDSILFAVTGDYNTTSGATRAYRSSPTHTESLYHYASRTYTGYHYTALATTTGSYTMGLTAPTAMSSNTVILEVRKP